MAQAAQPQLPPLEVPPDLRAALFAMPLHDAAQGGVKVRIVNDATGKPIPGAHVFVVDSGKMAQVRKRPGLEPTADFERGMLAPLLWSAERYVTGPEGIALVSRRIESSYGYAVTADGVGMIMPPRMRRGAAKPKDGVSETRVMRVETFSVEAESRGKPVVGLTIDMGPYGERGMDRFEPVVSGATNAQGELLIRMPRVMVNMFTRRGARLFAQARIVSAKPIRVMLTASSADTPVVLKLPPLGQVIVRLHDEKERAHTDLQTVTLLAIGQTQVRGPVVAQVPANAMDRQTNEEAHYHFVALGEKLIAHVHAASMAGTVEHQQDGPTRAGELVVFAVRAKTTPILAGRLLDTNGKLVQREQIAVVFSATAAGERPAASWNDRLAATTGAAGEFQIKLPKHLNNVSFRVYFVRRGEDGGGNTQYGGTAMREVAAPASGYLQLGDLRLQAEPVVVSGRLVDVDQQPVAGQPVAMVSTWLADDVTTTALTRGMGYLDRAMCHRATTDAQGRFTFRERRPRDVQRSLTAGGDWLVDPELQLRFGEREQVIEVNRPASMRLQFRKVPPRWMRVILRRDGVDYHNRILGNHADKILELKHLPAGRYDLSLVVQRREQVLIEGLEVLPGKDCADPRLRDIEWSKGLTVVNLRAQNAAGRHVGAQLRHIKHGKNVRSQSSIQELEVVAMQSDDVQLHLSEQRYESVLLTKLQPQMTVTMKPRRSVRIVLPKDLKLPDGLAMEIRAVEFPAKFSPRHRVLWAADTAVLLADGAGRHTVSLHMPSLRASGTLWSGEIKVDTGSEPTTIELPITAEQIQAVRKQLAVDHKK